jgi:hypothetical protein
VEGHLKEGALPSCDSYGAMGSARQPLIDVSPASNRPRVTIRYRSQNSGRTTTLLDDIHIRLVGISAHSLAERIPSRVSDDAGWLC